MANAMLLIVATVLVFCSLTCSATVYTVGDNSAWDISTDLDSWAKDKTFAVGDTLSFQYSQYHSVSELSEGNYQGCNTSNAIQSSSNGNTSIPLTSPGDRYFACGNRLHCLGGMKLHVNVVGNQIQSPTGAPLPQPSGTLPAGSSKTNTPSHSSFLKPSKLQSLVLTFFGLLIFFV